MDIHMAANAAPRMFVGMKLSTLEEVARALDQAGVRFILVGGIAVVAHGYGRLTRDLGLVIELEADVLRRAFTALESLGYRPRVPVTAAGLADPRQRRAWIEEKGMTVLNFHSDLRRHTPIDVFVTEPFDFDEEYGAADVFDISPGCSVRVVRLATLLRMKDEAGRPQDLADVAELRHLHRSDES
jgi:predicted nucleotidyltransferase